MPPATYKKWSTYTLPLIAFLTLQHGPLIFRFRPLNLKVNIKINQFSNVYHKTFVNKQLRISINLPFSVSSNGCRLNFGKSATDFGKWILGIDIDWEICGIFDEVLIVFCLIFDDILRDGCFGYFCIKFDRDDVLDEVREVFGDNGTTCKPSSFKSSGSTR